MGKAQILEEFDVRVRRIRQYSESTALSTFDATVMVWRPRKKEWAESKHRLLCQGFIYGIVENDHLHIRAERIIDPVYGEEWRIRNAERIQPSSELEMLKFLSSIKGVGQKYASLLVQAFGSDVISTILKTPDKLDTLGLSHTAKENIRKVIYDNKEYEKLLLYLELHGVAPRYAAKIFRKYGSSAQEKIYDNPYSLYLDGALDYSAVERLGRTIGGLDQRRNRLIAAVLACMRDDVERNGNMFLYRSSLNDALARFTSRIGVQEVEQTTDSELEDALEALIEGKRVIVDGSVALGPAIYLEPCYYSERYLADRLHRFVVAEKYLQISEYDLDQAIQQAQTDSGIILDRAQEHAIRTALTAPVSILTGGPGTGKTQTTKLLIEVVRKIHPDTCIRLCAPTGRAAVRLREMSDLPATTIHRMIGYPHVLLDEDRISCDLLIADEFSLCDCLLCAWMFRALDAMARVVIIGDHEQLPSVGPGLVLRDLIESGMFPVTRLTKVFRQKGLSLIVKNSSAIMAAKENESAAFEYSSGQAGDFYFIKASTPDKIVCMIRKSIARLLDEGFPIDQIEALSPIHLGPLGVDNLNIQLQELLNIRTRGYPLDNGLELRVGDKVIQTRNDYDLDVCNGEVGVVREITFQTERTVCVSYPGKEIWYDQEQVEDLDLAYAITTHRAQSSEFRVVLIPVHETSLFAENRNQIYTAITRAKERVILIGTKAALEEALKRIGSTDRNTNLIPRIKEFFGSPDSMEGRLYFEY